MKTVEFPIDEWVEDYLMDNWNVRIEWDSSGVVTHRDYNDYSITFDEMSVYGTCEDIKKFMEAYDLDYDEGYEDGREYVE